MNFTQTNNALRWLGTLIGASEDYQAFKEAGDDEAAKVSAEHIRTCIDGVRTALDKLERSVNA